MIIAITGVSCTGKTTIANILARRINAKVISLSEFVKEYNVYLKYDEKRKCYVVDEDVLREKFREFVGKLSERNLIVEGILAYCIPADIVIVLRTNPEILKNRLIHRYGNNELKIKENVEAEIVAYCTCKALEYSNNVFEIDTTKSIDACISEIIEVLSGKNHEKYKPRIDWGSAYIGIDKSM